MISSDWPPPRSRAGRARCSRASGRRRHALPRRRSDPRPSRGHGPRRHLAHRRGPRRRAVRHPGTAFRGPDRAQGGHRERAAGATLLAENAACPVQAYRAGRALWATQFHPEPTTEAFVERMVVYRDAGYFDADAFDEVSAHVRTRRSSSPPASALVRRSRRRRLAGAVRPQRWAAHATGRATAGRARRRADAATRCAARPARRRASADARCAGTTARRRDVGVGKVKPRHGFT